VPETNRNHLGSFLSALNNNVSAKRRQREPKLVWLNPLGYEDFNFLSLIFSVMSLNENGNAKHLPGSHQCLGLASYWFNVLHCPISSLAGSS
jgi:hypothetical protein